MSERTTSSGMGRGGPERNATERIKMKGKERKKKNESAEREVGERVARRGEARGAEDEERPERRARKCAKKKSGEQRCRQTHSFRIVRDYSEENGR